MKHYWIYGAFLEGVPVTVKSGMQKSATPSVTEAEAMAAVHHCVQDTMLFILEVLKSIGMQVKLPMILWCDNKGAVNLERKWKNSPCLNEIEYILREQKIGHCARDVDFWRDPLL